MTEYDLTPSRWLAHEGDTVVVYQGVTELTQITLKKGEFLRGRFGEFLHDEFIGRPFGAKIFSRQGSGWVYFFALTPELWTSSLEHRTQILYTPDISMVTFCLDVTPGSVVIESGTGTGSLSHALLRAVQPHGHLYTYEFNKHRTEAVREEFIRNRVTGCVTLEHRDVCSDGFDSRLEKCVDAVFLDLPKPWDALPDATKVLKSSGRICLFSPCIEQVQQNCKSLEEHGFQSIQTMETLVKSYSVLLDAKGAKSPISLFHNKQQEVEEETTTTTTEKQESHKRQRDTSDDAADLQPTSNKRAVRRRNKKGQAYIQTVNDGGASSDAAHAPYQVKGTRPDQPTASQLVGNERTQRAKLPIQNPVKDEPLTLQHSPLLRGHTGYLTFAVWR